MTRNKQELVVDIQERLSSQGLEIKQNFIEKSVDNAFDTDTSTLNHERIVKYIVNAIKDAHDQNLLKDNVYGTDDQIIVEEVPDITDLNYK